MRTGTLKANGIVVAEITASFVGTAKNIEAKAAFVNNLTGQTHGWTTGKTWSRNTISCLEALRDSMEADLAGDHFSEGVVGTTQPNVGSTTDTPKDGGGLAEHLGEGVSVPSV